MSSKKRITNNAHLKLLLGLIFGIVLGISLKPFKEHPWIVFLSSQFLFAVGQIFLRLIFMVVVPMVFSALVLGVYELTQGQSLGKVLGKTLFFTLIASSMSVFIGISITNLFKPGAGVHLEAIQSDALTSLQSVSAHAESAKSIGQTIAELIPKNPLAAAVNALEGDMLSLMVFALIFGIALGKAYPGNKKESSLLNFFEQIYHVCLKIIDFAMVLAPYAVFSIVANTTLKFGTDVFASVLYYMFVVVLGLLLQQLIVYSSLLKIFTHRSPWKFFNDCKDVYLYAFATSSSNATLPLSLEVAETKLKIPEKISRFVLTIGATANQNGTALFEGVTVLFLAQAYSIDLNFAQQLQIIGMSILAGIGTAGVPGGSLPLILILLKQVGIPSEGMALVLGVDRFLDMCRTVINVSGDIVISALVAGKSTVPKRSS